MAIDPEVGNLPDGSILIEGSRIADVGPNLTIDGAKEIDGRGRIAIPGFNDTHRHTWQSLLRAVGADRTLARYFQGVRSVVEDLDTADGMRIAHHLGALSALDGGSPPSTTRPTTTTTTRPTMPWLPPKG